MTLVRNQFQVNLSMMMMIMMMVGFLLLLLLLLLWSLFLIYTVSNMFMEKDTVKMCVKRQ